MINKNVDSFTREQEFMKKKNNKMEISKNSRIFITNTKDKCHKKLLKEKI